MVVASSHQCRSAQSALNPDIEGKLLSLDDDETISPRCSEPRSRVNDINLSSKFFIDSKTARRRYMLRNIKHL